MAAAAGRRNVQEAARGGHAFQRAQQAVQAAAASWSQDHGTAGRHGRQGRLGGGGMSAGNERFGDLFGNLGDFVKRKPAKIRLTPNMIAAIQGGQTLVFKVEGAEIRVEKA